MCHRFTLVAHFLLASRDSMNGNNRFENENELHSDKFYVRLHTAQHLQRKHVRKNGKREEICHDSRKKAAQRSNVMYVVCAERERSRVNLNRNAIE